MSLRLPLLFATVLTLLVLGASAAAGANRGLPAHPTWFEDPGHEPGTVVPNSYIVQQRGYFSITAQMHLRDLTPGHHYTLWWVIYNNPASCVDGCDPDDLTAAATTGVNPAGIGVHYGGSYVAPDTGKLDAGTRLLEDSVGGCQTVGPYASLCKPMLDAAIAEATILLVDHGPAENVGPFVAAEAFSIGCKSYVRFDTVVTSYGTTGFDCFSPQAIYLP
jgi:hypothetical protein